MTLALGLNGSGLRQTGARDIGMRDTRRGGGLCRHGGLQGRGQINPFDADIGALHRHALGVGSARHLGGGRGFARS